jgi:hypothetical protein
MTADEMEREARRRERAIAEILTDPTNYAKRPQFRRISRDTFEMDGTIYTRTEK